MLGLQQKLAREEISARRVRDSNWNRRISKIEALGSKFGAVELYDDGIERRRGAKWRFPRRFEGSRGSATKFGDDNLLCNAVYMRQSPSFCELRKPRSPEGHGRTPRSSPSHRVQHAQIRPEVARGTAPFAHSHHPLDGHVPSLRVHQSVDGEGVEDEPHADAGADCDVG